MPKKILGRDPVVFFALLAALLLAVIKFVPFTPEVSGALNGLVLAGAGLGSALTVATDKVLPALTGVAQAVFAVFLAYGSPLAEHTQTAILELIAVAVAFFVRTQVSAKLDSGGDNRLTAAYQNGYQNGQDDMTYSDAQALEVTRETAGQGRVLPDARETGAHGHTEVIPAVGDVYEEDRHDPR